MTHIKTELEQLCAKHKKVMDVLRAIHEAGENATQGEATLIGKDCRCDSCYCTHDVYIDSKFGHEKWTAEKRDDAQFITTCANARPAIAELMEE